PAGRAGPPLSPRRQAGAVGLGRPPAPAPAPRRRGARLTEFARGAKLSACTPANPGLNTAPRRGAAPRGRLGWPVRLSVRTSGFQPEKRGSTPLRAAILSIFSSPCVPNAAKII